MWSERGVGWHRADQSETLATQCFQRRSDHVDFLATQMTRLSGVRIETAHQDTGPGNSEFLAQVTLQDAHDLLEPRGRDGGCNRARSEERRVGKEGRTRWRQ